MQYIAESSLYNFDAWSGGKDTLEALIRNNVVDDVEAMLEELMVDEIWSDTEINDFLWFERDSIIEYLDMIDIDKFNELVEEQINELLDDTFGDKFCINYDCDSCKCRKFMSMEDCKKWYIDNVLTNSEFELISTEARTIVVDEYGEPFIW